ncbi:MAG: hypothetical protein E6248_07465 [Clostridium sp.]|uniref:hypothetical protein n=1 Tax=Clostridium sp. TaxID=1506 RepID=UPI002911F5AF|nr:hypothetical protein [Clostridium sp.]MDU5110270.1 hypothetical protein [Clostridium sp.]
MNSNGWGNWEDLLRGCGYTNSSDNTDNTGCNDIPNGFQNINPQLFILIGDVLGNIIAGNIPFNVQNAIGNWFELLGQVILTFNAQQQYFQSGPGRYYDPKNYNVDNPSCSTNPTDSTSNTTSTSNSSNSSSSSKASSSSPVSESSTSNDNDININKLQELEDQVQELTNELNKIKILLQK